MSHTIFYRAMFIKMSDGTYIPLIESGDNNVWDVDRNRRSRDWCSCRWMHETDEQRRRFSLTEEEILDTARREITSTVEKYAGEEPPFGGSPYRKEQVLADLGFFNCIRISGHTTTSASCFFNFIKSGIRNAVTFDEMRCPVRLSWYELSEDKKTSKWCTDYAKDESELALKWAGHLAQGRTPSIGLSEGNAEYAWETVKARNRRPRTERKKPTEQFVIAFDYGGVERFLVKLTSRNLKFNPWKDCAHKYASRKVAENTAASISRRFGQLSNIRIEPMTANN